MSDLSIAALAAPVPGSAWCFDHAFVDWLTIRQPNDGRYASVNDGHVVRISSDGEVEFSTAISVEVAGSFDSSARFRVTPEFVELSFNPSRFDRADNLFGYSFEDCLVVCNRVLARFDLPPLVASGHRVFNRWDNRLKRFCSVPLCFSVTRLDVTLNVQTGSAGRLAAYLRFLRRQTLPRRKTRAFGSTVVFGQKGSSLTVYDKASEMRSHGVDSSRARVADWCESVGLARVELRLNRDFLKRKNLRFASDLSHGVLVDCLCKEVASMPTDSFEEDVSLLSGKELGSLCMWKSGFDVREKLSRSTFFRHKKAIFEATGYDISAEPPLRFEAKHEAFSTEAAVPPDWYELPDVKEG